jgi:hypothetical protein
MDAKIIKKSETSFTIEIEIPYAETMLKSEELIQEKINEVGMLATAEALRQFDADGSPIVVAGEKMTSKGLIPKPYQTPYGEIRIERHIYQGSLGGRGYCPLEVKARIITTATPKFAKMVSSKYTDLGGVRVRKDLKDNHGRDVSKSHIQNICEVVGSISSMKEDKWTYQIPSLEEEVKSISIGIDGTCMLTCEDGYRQAMVGTIALYNDDGARLHTIYGAAAPEYGKQVFLNRMDNEIDRVKQLYPDVKYVGLADGARDNWSFLEKHTDQQLIDFYHASGYIGNVGNAAVKKSEREEWKETACHNLKHESGAAEVILLDMKQCLEKRMSKEKKEKVSAAVTYFENNSHRMDYATNTAQNLPIGSGITEAACKVIVKERLCRSGMKWKEGGASVVLTLRCLNYTDGRWEQFWNKIDRYGFNLAA